MRITRLVLLDFGKFHQREVTLSSGLNLVVGANESGKTTLCRFLRSMLYGLDRERGLRARKDDYTRYRPWDYGRYQGILEFEQNGEQYRLLRNFLSTEKQVVLTRLSTGEELANPEQFLEESGLVSEAVFVNSFFVGNFCGTDGLLAGDLKNHLANLAGTGGAGIDLLKSLEWLNTQRKEKQKQLPEKEISECMAALMQKEEVSGRVILLQQETEKLLREQKALEEEQKALQRAVEQLWKEQQKAANEKEACHREESNWRESFLDKEKELSEQKRQSRHWMLGGCAFVLIGAIFGIVGALLEVIGISYGKVLGAGAVFLGALGVLTGWLVSKKKLRTVSGKEQKLVLEKQSGEEMWAKKNAEEEKRYRQSTEQLKETQKNMALGYERLKELLPVLEQEKLMEEQLEEQLQKIEATEHRYEMLLKLRGERMQEIAALDLAMETLRRISGELYQEYGEKFAKALETYAMAFTDGAYRRLTADEALALHAITGERSVEVSDVSFGTGEQFYLALRFAAMDAFDPEKKLPVILDDSFSSFDAQRLESAMLALAQSGRQVLLLSCSGREEACAKGLGITYEKVFE